MNSNVPAWKRHNMAREHAWRQGFKRAPTWCVWWVANDGSRRIASTHDLMTEATLVAYVNLRPASAQLIAGAMRDAQSEASVDEGTYQAGSQVRHLTAPQLRDLYPGVCPF